MISYKSGDKPYLDGSGKTQRDDTGLAVSFDQKFTEKVTGFFRYGWADDKVNEEKDFYSYGGQIVGLFDSRKDDVLGFGYAHALRSYEGLSSTNTREINLIETYYNIKVSKNLEISPDIQVVTHPGGLQSEAPATIFGLRCRMKF